MAFNPVSNPVIHVLVDGHVCGGVVVAKLTKCPSLAAASFLVVFVKILTVSQRRAVRLQTVCFVDSLLRIVVCKPVFADGSIKEVLKRLGFHQPVT